MAQRWTNEEIRRCCFYSDNYDSNVPPTWEDVADNLNEEFGTNRTPEACRKIVAKWFNRTHELVR